MKRSACGKSGRVRIEKATKTGPLGCDRLILTHWPAAHMFPAMNSHRGLTMANANNSKRKIWIGASVLVLAAAGVLVAGQYYPPHGAMTSGTIAPAERYHNAQVGDNDVKTGDSSTAQMMQTDQFTQAVNSQAASNAASSNAAQSNAAASNAAAS